MSRLGLQGIPALVRIARREVRRHPRRSALIVALIAVPGRRRACGLATQATLATSQRGAPRRRNWDEPTSSSVTPTPAPAATAPSARAIGSQRPSRRPFGMRCRRQRTVSRTVAHVSTSPPATVRPAPLSSLPTRAARVNDGTLRLDGDGLPARPGETALAPGSPSELDVEVGDAVTLHPGGTQLEVVGLARASGARRDWTVVVPAGTIPSTAWLVDLPPGLMSKPHWPRCASRRDLAGIQVRTPTACSRSPASTASRTGPDVVHDRHPRPGMDRRRRRRNVRHRRPKPPP